MAKATERTREAASSGGTASTDDTVVLSATEARASEPVLADEATLDKDAPAPGATTEDGIPYSEVAHPSDPMERLEKREIELGADMDYGEHRRTYQMFIEAAKWGTMVVIALLVAMAVGFFLSGGFIGGIVVFFGAVLAAFVFLR